MRRKDEEIVEWIGEISADFDSVDTNRNELLEYEEFRRFCKLRRRVCENRGEFDPLVSVDLTEKKDEKGKPAIKELYELLAKIQDLSSTKATMK